MSFFGPISSLYDFLTFGVMLRVFHAGPSLFRSGWFVESLTTQTLVIFVIRTRRVPFFKSRPSRPLLVATLACAALGVAIPYIPPVARLRLPPLPLSFLAVLVGMIVTYLALAQSASRSSSGPREARPSPARSAAGSAASCAPPRAGTSGATRRHPRDVAPSGRREAQVRPEPGPSAGGAPAERLLIGAWFQRGNGASAVCGPASSSTRHTNSPGGRASTSSWPAPRSSLPLTPDKEAGCLTTERYQHAVAGQTEKEPRSARALSGRQPLPAGGPRTEASPRRRARSSRPTRTIAWTTTNDVVTAATVPVPAVVAVVML